MNKLILISLVIFFTICSRSWAEEVGEVDEKGLICKSLSTHTEINEETMVFYFLNNKARYISFNDEATNPIITKIIQWSYQANAKNIKFLFDNAKFIANVNRITLELSFKYYSSTNKKTLAKYQCEVTDWSGILEHYKPALEKHKEEMKKNKI